MIRVGVVGLGHNGLAHIEAHRRVGLSEVVALCDANPQRLAEAAQRFGISRTYASADEMAAQPDIQAVSINTGDAFHAEPFIAVVRAGKHVLVEKPLANDLSEVERMVAAAREGDPGCKLAVGYILRFNPVFEAVRAMCRGGQLGQVYYLEGDYIHNLLYQAGQTDTATGANWYLEQEKPMVGGGSHPLDLLRWFSGQEVVEVASWSNHVAFPAMRHDDCQVALFRFDGGAVAKVAALYAPRLAMPPYYNLRVYGTMGTVERDQAAVAQEPEDVHPPLEPIPGPRTTGHAYDPEIADWLRAIAEDRAPRCDLFDGANSTAAALVAVEAMRAGHPLSVPVYRRQR